jgi:hypothetical protein
MLNMVQSVVATTHHHDMKIHVNIHEQYQHDIYKKSQSSIKIDRKSNPTPS